MYIRNIKKTKERKKPSNVADGMKAKKTKCIYSHNDDSIDFLIVYDMRVQPLLVS